MLKLDDVREARDRIGSLVRRTPLERSETLSRMLGTNVYLKYELFQKTGSFKPRGAFNTMLSLSDEQRAAGVRERVVGALWHKFVAGLCEAGRGAVGAL